MNFENACNILNLSNDFTEKELRKSYLVSSLKYHPDKNKSDEATLIFQNIQDAYEYLNSKASKTNKTNKTNEKTSHEPKSYADIMESFTSMMAEQYKNITRKDDFDLVIHNFKNKCTNFSLKMLEKLERDNLAKLYEYIYLYGDLLNISETMLANVRDILEDKLKNDSIIILNPSIKNLIENDIYKLDHEGQVVYVPLWIDEANYDLSGANITIKCIPDLSDNINIDNRNNIHIKLQAEINNILKENISINLGEKVFEIPSDKLLIKAYQSYTIKNKGLASFSSDLDISHYNDIIAHIYIT